jgi:hypothetical protein
MSDFSQARRGASGRQQKPVSESEDMSDLSEVSVEVFPTKKRK